MNYQTVKLRKPIRISWKRPIYETRKIFNPGLGRARWNSRTASLSRHLASPRSAAVSLGSNCYISPAAHVLTTRFWLGENSWIAVGAIVRGHVAIGANID